VPFVDMLNHNESGCAFRYDDETDSFSVTLGQPVMPGEQVTLNYGGADGVTSLDMLLTYGFVPKEPARLDTIELEGAFSLQDWDAAPGDAAMLEEKKQLLASSRYTAPRTFHIGSQLMDPAVICALRLVYLELVELSECCNGNWQRALNHAPISARNERLVALSLRTRLKQVTGQDQRNVDDDLRSLACARAVDEVDHLLCAALRLRINRQLVAKDVLDRLDLFLEATETESHLNLFDFLPSYMPKMRVL